MNTTIKAGILIGLLCGAWTFVIGFTGWYKDPVMLNMFWMVIPIQIGVLLWGLKQTAAEGRTYGGQVGTAVLMSLIGGVILIFSSLLFTTVVFPNYFEELRVVGEDVLRAQGKSEAEIAAQMNAAASMQTPMMQAIMGCVGTVVTGLVASLIIAIFMRKK
jgi:hypothetical protein